MLAEEGESTNDKENKLENGSMTFGENRRGRNSSEGGSSSDWGSDDDKCVCGENGRTSLTTVNEEDGIKIVDNNNIETMKSKKQNLIGIGQNDKNERRVKPWRANGKINCGKRSLSLPAQFEYDDDDDDVREFDDAMDEKYLLDSEEVMESFHPFTLSCFHIYCKFNWVQCSPAA